MVASLSTTNIGVLASIFPLILSVGPVFVESSLLPSSFLSSFLSSPLLLSSPPPPLLSLSLSPRRRPTATARLSTAFATISLPHR